MSSVFFTRKAGYVGDVRGGQSVVWGSGLGVGPHKAQNFDRWAFRFSSVLMIDRPLDAVG